MPVLRTSSEAPFGVPWRYTSISLQPSYCMEDSPTGADMAYQAAARAWVQHHQVVRLTR
jgi:hypothetical protein